MSTSLCSCLDGIRAAVSTWTGKLEQQPLFLKLLFDRVFSPLHPSRTEKQPEQKGGGKELHLVSLRLSGAAAPRQSAPSSHVVHIRWVRSKLWLGCGMHRTRQLALLYSPDWRGCSGTRCRSFPASQSERHNGRVLISHTDSQSDEKIDKSS